MGTALAPPCRRRHFSEGLVQACPQHPQFCHAACLPRGAMQVGISSVWWEGNPCNMHLNDLAAEVKAGVEEAGLVGLRFNTIGVSDGISMGTDGMSYSLQSRDIIAGTRHLAGPPTTHSGRLSLLRQSCHRSPIRIARAFAFRFPSSDSIETVMSAQWYDANISLPGCDKNMPGTIMAMARVNRPSLMIYGGAGRWRWQLIAACGMASQGGHSSPAGALQCAQCTSPGCTCACPKPVALVAPLPGVAISCRYHQAWVQ